MTHVSSRGYRLFLLLANDDGAANSLILDRVDLNIAVNMEP